MSQLPLEVWRQILWQDLDAHSYEWLLQLGYVCHHFALLLQTTPQLFWWKRPRRMHLQPRDLQWAGSTLTVRVAHWTLQPLNRYWDESTHLYGWTETGGVRVALKAGGAWISDTCKYDEYGEYDEKEAQERT